jgi:hypothetical protein
MKNVNLCYSLAECSFIYNWQLKVCLFLVNGVKDTWQGYGTNSMIIGNRHPTSCQRMILLRNHQAVLTVFGWSTLQIVKQIELCKI